MEIIAFAVSFASLLISTFIVVIYLTRLSIGPDLEAFFDEEDLLVFRNPGTQRLEMWVDAYLDCARDRRGRSKSVATYHLNLAPGTKKAFGHLFSVTLNYMGYHQGVTHIVELEGWYKSTATRLALKRRFRQVYKRILTAQGWLSVDETLPGNRVLEPRDREHMKRENIPPDLSIQNESRFFQERAQRQKPMNS